MMEQLSLFGNGNDLSAPLASRMRPETLADYIGQKHLLGEGKILRQILQKDQVSSMIFLGAAGRREDYPCPYHREAYESGVCGFQRGDKRDQGDQRDHEAGGERPSDGMENDCFCG